MSSSCLPRKSSIWIISLRCSRYYGKNNEIMGRRKTSNRERNISIEQEENTIIDMVKRAIKTATGLEPEDYINKSLRMDGVKIRYIFVYICRRDEVRIAAVAKALSRQPVSIKFMTDSAKEFLKVDEKFRQLFDRIDEAYKSL